MTTVDLAGASGSGFGLLDRARTVAGPGFNRWLVPPAALIVLAAGFSVMEQLAAPCVTGISIAGVGPLMKIFPVWVVGSVVAAIT